jgi:hypothetical protein
MNESLAKAEELFHRAMELPPAERGAFLKSACDDVALQEEVAALLRASQVADRWMSGTPEFEAEPRVGEKVGAVIGRYKLVERIGEGGFGVVYKAEQLEPLRRTVALKIVKLGMDTREVIARFEAERQALALMDHPNIAKVFDAGATETGRPYFVMELVSGATITTFCDEEGLGTAERLDVFARVCRAIQHAHARGVVHRDIKPGNILVSRREGVPHPVVIDFGVAKALNQRLTERTLFTNCAQMIGTPAYMSPEQAEMRKDDVDARSDIYSLGVLLYELVTGTPPFPEERLRSASYAEIQRIIREEEPEKPSTRATRGAGVEAKHSRTRSVRLVPAAFPTDLDAIILKCLEKMPVRRYETTEALASDVGRFLEGEPIRARAAGGIYRIGKLVRRRRGVLMAVALVVMAAGAGFGVNQLVRRPGGSIVFENVRAALPARQADTPAQLLDLSKFYNVSLEGNGGGFLEPGSPHAIQKGRIRLSDVVFDVRGAIRLHSPNPFYVNMRAPERVNGIKVNQICRRLHFLHYVYRSRNAGVDGEIVATYVVKYSDGERAEIPIKYGEDVLTWTSYNGARGSADPREMLANTNSTIVWKGTNNLNFPVRMSRTTWSNPRPEVRIKTVDLVSGMSQCSHVVVAITTER